jgi:predicted dithiol-disulfide oxidoreductase (DUF899 family)
MAAVSRAPYPKLAAYKKRMRWSFPWVSSLGSDFNVDYRVSFTDEKAEKVDYNYRLRPWSVVLCDLHCREDALAEPAGGGWIGAGSG